jgi:hypothetical protein
MAFILYTPNLKRPKSNSKKNTVGYNAKHSRLLLYRSVAQHLSTEFVYLYYDQTEKIIGIEPVATEDLHTVKIHGKTSKYLTIKHFINSFEIPLTENGTFPVTYEENKVIFKVS